MISLVGVWAYAQVLAEGMHAFIGDDVILGLASLWFAALLPVFVHELGHALTVKHFAREVPRGGLMLYMGLPAAFVDTTDIWMEPRRARLAVTWNGPYTGLIVGGIAACFMVLVPDAGINGFLFRMAGYAYMTVFLNINPLLKFDGYYLLSDALDISALRERSFSFIRGKLPARMRTRTSLSRDEWIYTIYGLLSFAWMGYAIYFAGYFWQSRIQAAFQVILGDGYSLFARAFSFLLVAGLISIIALLILALIRLAGRMLARFVRGGGLARHGRLGWMLAVTALLLSLALPLIFDTSTDIAVTVAALVFTVLGLYAFVRAVFSYWPARRSLALAGFGLGLLLALAAQLAPQIGLIKTSSAAVLVLAGLIFVGLPQRRRLGLPLIGLAAATLTGFLLVLALPSFRSGPDLYLFTGLVAVGTWLSLLLRGSARAPAAFLLFAGALIFLVAQRLAVTGLNLALFGLLLMAAAGVHWAWARLPDLTRMKVDGVSTSAQAIGFSVAALIRRVIARVYFEMGWMGVHDLGHDFNQAMHAVGLAVTIQGNRFTDEALASQSVVEITNNYGAVLDTLHAGIRARLGMETTRLTFGYGIDLLPWENREVVSELLLSRRAWGLSLQQSLSEARAEICELLKRVPLFIQLPESSLDALASRLRPWRYGAGEDVVIQGSPGDRFYILANGSVDILQADESGQVRRIAQKGPGQFFGETALVSDQPRNATVRTSAPSLLYSLERADFDALVKAHLNIELNLKVVWLTAGCCAQCHSLMNCRVMNWIGWPYSSKVVHLPRAPWFSMRAIQAVSSLSSNLERCGSGGMWLASRSRFLGAAPVNILVKLRCCKTVRGLPKFPPWRRPYYSA